ncbi:MAG: glycosyltransferase family 2 protein [Moraxellaceae bacterium]|nr:glycosyltransferase family 2 protein [Moraxellaceae bacterium]
MIVKNEEENLKISLPAIVDWVDEIIILDSGSTDNSQKIAEKYNAKWFVNTDWQGFGKQRQLAQSYASGDWILALDADEEVTTELKNSILSVVKDKPSNIIYGIKRLDYVFEHCIDNSYWGVKAHWRLYPNTFSYDDNLVHESVVLKNAQTQKLSGFLRHHTAPTPYFWLEKRLQYALSWAKDRHQQGKKIGFYKILLNPLWAFFKQFIIDGRFLQGSYGFVYSLLFCQYTFNKYAILYDMNRQRDSYQADFQPHSINYQNLPKLPKKITHKTCTLSVVLIIKNEQKHLPACLYQIYDIADEIIILDSGSTDKSKEIADYFQAKWFVNTDWQGFGKQRQIAQKYATGDYILMIDPDELIDNLLKENILLLLKQKLITNKVFAIKYLNIFCGHKVYGKWYSDKIIRFYANRHFQYHDYDVHESVNFQQAKVEILNGYIQHFTNDNLYHFILKRTGYSHDWAIERYKKGKNPASLLSLPLRAFFSFLREYILRGLCFGKAYGFLLAVSAGNYTFNKYLMLWYEYERKQSK